MTTHRVFHRDWLVAAGCAAALAVGGAVAAPAQEARVDPRWQAWLGCWELEDQSKPEVQGAGRSLVCMIPGGDAATVEIVSIADGREASRETVSASGETREVSREGCTGWERASWAPGGERLYLRAEYACGAGVSRRSSGMLAMTPGGEWLDLQAVTVRDRTGIRVLRYRPAAPGVVLADEIAAAVQPPGAAVRTARLAAGGSVRTSDVIEASREADPAIVQAWLAERGQPFALDARDLATLADAGVSGEVTDVMVALSYPRLFRVNAVSRGPEDRLRTDDAGKPMVSEYGPYGTYSPYGWDYFSSPYGYSRYGWYSPFGWNAYGPYGYGWNPYSPYGYGGYGYRGSYGGWYWGGEPVIIVAPGGTTPAGGRVVKGRGYQRPAGANPGSSEAHPRGSTARDGGSASSGSSSGSSASSARPASSSGSSSSGSTGRTAHPRPPNDH